MSSNERDTKNMEYLRLADRPRTTFLIGVFCGIVGVAVDLDHIVCAIIRMGAWDIGSGLYGCRLWHHLILFVSSTCGGIAVALLAGLYLAIVFFAIVSRTRNAFTIKTELLND